MQRLSFKFVQIFFQQKKEQYFLKSLFDVSYVHVIQLLFHLIDICYHWCE